MTAIKLVVSDVDGTLLTKNKTLTEASRNAVRRLHEAGIGFTIVSSRPTIGMGFLIEPLAITLPVGAFNGSSIVDPQLKPIEQHLIPPDTAQRAIGVLTEFGVDIWLFTNEQWLTRNPDGEYVGHEKLAIKHDPVIVADFAPYLTRACKIVGASSDAALLMRCEAAMQEAVGAQATAVRSQTYYLDVTPPGHDKGTFVTAMAKRLGVPPPRSLLSATCRMICRCLPKADCRLRWAMRRTTSSSARRTSRPRTRTTDLPRRWRWSWKLPLAHHMSSRRTPGPITGLR